MRNRWVTTLLAFLVVIIFATACSSGVPSTIPVSTTTLDGATPVSTTTLDGATLVQERCSKCHPLGRIESTNRTAADWKTIVDLMISRGAKLTPDEETLVVNYLATKFGK